MAQRVMQMTQTFALTMALHLAIVSAQTSCIPAITSLSPCLGFVTGNSSTTMPSSSCCSQLASVVSSQAQCLCSFLNGGAAQIGLAVNQTRALTLPGACDIKTPPMSQCNAISHAPAASPTMSPIGAPAAAAPPSTPSSVSGNQSPATPSTPSVPHAPAAGGRAKTVPAPPTSHNTNNGSVKKSTQKLMAFLVIAACASTLTVF